MKHINSQDGLHSYLWAITEYAMVHRSAKCACATMSKPELFRWLSFCHLTGRLWSRFEGGKVAAIVVCWADWVERVEAKAEYSRAQFEWKHQTPGDCLFVGDVIGNAKALREIWNEACVINPAFLVCPIYTFRRKRLVRLSVGTLERMFRKAIA